MKITHRYDSNKVLFEADDCDTTKELVLLALKSGANLRGANLRGVNLRCADLRCANLRCANLRGADLRGADLSGADLRGANLRGVNLRCADLRCANLRCANLRGADLRGADLSGADLSGADLSGADLSGADLSGASTTERYVQVSCIGSVKRMTTYCFDDDIVWCGCFTGTLEEFEEKVKSTHKDNEQYLKEYLGFILYVKSLK